MFSQSDVLKSCGKESWIVQVGPVFDRGPQACPVNNLIELTELLTELTAVADGADSSWQLTELTTSQIVQISLQHAV